MTNIETSMPATVRPQFSDRFMRELPRFFGEGIVSMLREAFQNARRSGATKVQILQEGNRLSISDNGQGLGDPQLLLTGGATGWNESEVIEPAGLGVFSYLNPELVTSVTFRSRDWRVTLTPDVLNTPLEGVPVERAEPLFGGGFGVTLVFKSDKAVTPADITSAYGLFEFELYVNGNRVTPRDKPLFQVATAWGRVEAYRESAIKYPESNRYVFIAWEGQPIHDPVFDNNFIRVFRAAANTLGYAAAYSRVKFVWHPAAHLPLRPKLPDRRTFIQDGRVPLPEIAEALATAIAPAQRTEAAKRLLELEDTIEADTAIVVLDALGVSLPPRDYRHPLLSEAGYLPCLGGRKLTNQSYYSTPQVTVYADGDSADSQDVPAITTLLSRTPVFVSNEDVERTINTLHLGGEDDWTNPATLVGEDDERALPFDIGDLDLDALPDTPIVLADKLELGDTTLPYLLRESYEPLVVMPSNGSEPAQVIERALNDEELLLWIFAEASDDDDLRGLAGDMEVPSGSSSTTYEPSDLTEELRLQFAAQYLVPSEVVERYRELEGLDRRADKALREIHDGHNYPPESNPLRPAWDALKSAQGDIASELVDLRQKYPSLL